jgi:murein DD-endopeptidase MepM/ murein hydrolase activator NlpD
MEETGSVSYLSILFSASSFTELLDYAMLISEVMEYHNGVIDALVETQDQLKAAKEELEDDKAEQEELKAEQESNKADLQEQEAEVDTLIAQIQALESDYQSELDKYEEESDKLSSSLKTAEAKYQKELEEIEAKRKAEAAAAAAASGGSSSTAASGDWYWPLPGRYYISSSFAYRYHPITGKWSHHTGNDIPAPSGTSIHAAQAGVVTEVGYSSVYGNYIRVSHGGGYSTFYAHMKSTAIVAEGASVTKGQVIGYVGTTGYSTGNHLHFELWINNSRADSLSLYPNLTFTY